MKNNKLKIANLIKHLRQTKNLSLRQVINNANNTISQTELSYIERGLRVPKDYTLFQIANGLNTSPQEFYEYLALPLPKTTPKDPKLIRKHLRTASKKLNISINSLYNRLYKLPKSLQNNDEYIKKIKYSSIYQKHDLIKINKRSYTIKQLATSPLNINKIPYTTMLNRFYRLNKKSAKELLAKKFS